jgi:hypothetical protein
MDHFLSRLKGIYSELIYNLDISNLINSQQKKLVNGNIYFKILYEQLSLQANRVCEILDNLYKVNHNLMKENQQQLLEMYKKIGLGC